MSAAPAFVCQAAVERMIGAFDRCRELLPAFAPPRWMRPTAWHPRLHRFVTLSAKALARYGAHLPALRFSAEHLRERQLRVLRLEAAIALHDELLKDVLDTRLHHRAALFTLGREVMAELRCYLDLEPDSGTLGSFLTGMEEPFRKRAAKIRKTKRRARRQRPEGR